MFFDVLKEEEMDSEPITRVSGDAPYLVSVPHSGTLIPLDVLDYVNLGRELLLDTDLYTDRLYESPWMLIARLSPYACNLNRQKKPKGPGHLAEDPIHTSYLDGSPSKKPGIESVKLLEYYDVYYGHLRNAVDYMLDKQGTALVFDCHSMGSKSRKGEERPDFVVSTVDGASADRKFVDALMSELPNSELNTVFKGGAITRQTGNPERGVHCIQIETRKGLYYDEETLELKDWKETNKLLQKGFKACKRLID